MAIIQYFDGQKNLFLAVWQATIESDEWFHYAAKLTSHPSWSGTQRLLADLQFARDTSTIGDEEITRALHIYIKDRQALVGKRIAVVARDEFGKARHLGDLLAHFGVSLVVFNNLDTACLFLGVDVKYASHKIHELRKQLQEE